MVKKASIQNQTNSSTINKSSGGFVCNCGKTCSKILSCEEAYFQLNNCGCSARDGDDNEVLAKVFVREDNKDKFLNYLITTS